MNPVITTFIFSSVAKNSIDPPPQIRLLTPKPKTPGTTTTAKSKGCAFLEFSHKNALQQGIKLHGSTLDGRRINVELTAGGGGKSESRVQKVQARNKQLLEQRVCAPPHLSSQWLTKLLILIEETCSKEIGRRRKYRYHRYCTSAATFNNIWNGARSTEKTYVVSPRA